MQKSWGVRIFAGLLLFLIIGLAGYIWILPKINYSTGERAGWLQKISHKGWICKTWEGELNMTTQPGVAQEKFYFSVWDEKVARQLAGVVGERMILNYDEKLSLLNSCFGETKYWITGLEVKNEEARMQNPPVKAPEPAAAPTKIPDSSESKK